MVWIYFNESQFRTLELQFSNELTSMVKKVNNSWGFAKTLMITLTITLGYNLNFQKMDYSLIIENCRIYYVQFSLERTRLHKSQLGTVH